MKMTNEIFLDTSVVIRSDLGTKEIKQRISERVRNYDGTVTGLVVRQEYKRRLLAEAQYLLRQLHEKKSLAALHDHVLNVLPPQQERKRKISLGLIAKFFPNAEEPERTERFARTLRTLLRVGLQQFDETFDRIVWHSGCSCAKFPVTEVVPYKRYDLGPTKCSKTGGTCGITDFLKSRKVECNAILRRLKELAIEKKSKQLQSIERLLEKVLEDPSNAPNLDPCLTVGDLVIALESVGIRTFYTLNSKESQHLCRALNQDLIIRPNDPTKEEHSHLHTDSVWAEY
jgi:hypothetical protein